MSDKNIKLCNNGCLGYLFTNIDNKKLLLLHENENNLTKFSTKCSICLCKL